MDSRNVKITYICKDARKSQTVVASDVCLLNRHSQTSLYWHSTTRCNNNLKGMNPWLQMTLIIGDIHECCSWYSKKHVVDIHFLAYRRKKPHLFLTIILPHVRILNGYELYINEKVLLKGGLASQRLHQFSLCRNQQPYWPWADNKISGPAVVV